MYLFSHGNPEEFLFFINNFSMTLAATGTLEIYAKIQYLCKPVLGEALHQFDMFSSDKENT